MVLDRGDEAGRDIQQIVVFPVRKLTKRDHYPFKVARMSPSIDSLEDLFPMVLEMMLLVASRACAKSI
jgi:hypothetical protein